MIWLAAIVFGLAETAHFGWNIIPKSGAEWACDGITLLLFACARINDALEHEGRSRE